MLFWNVNKVNVKLPDDEKKRQAELNRRTGLNLCIDALIKEYDLDIIIFAECTDPFALIPEGWSEKPVNSKVCIYYKSELSELFSEDNFAYKPIDSYFEQLNKAHYKVDRGSPGGVLFYMQPFRLLIAAFHLKSRVDTDPITQYFQAQAVAEKVRRFKNAYPQSYGVLIGDFNMQPHEPGMTHEYCFNARTYPPWTSAEEPKSTETHWYNPFPGIWNDHSNIISNANNKGSHYYNKSLPTDGPWHLLDYALFSPEVTRDGLLNMPWLYKSNAEMCGRAELLPRAVPQLSDHLPVLFRLKLPVWE